MKDFTATYYALLIDTLKTHAYLFYTISDYTKVENKSSHMVLLRHDIDAMPFKALEIAKVEKKAGVRSSFFLKIDPQIFIPGIVAQIAEFDHEIGYHYEDLARNHGNYAKAISDFESNLDALRKTVPVTTICADGDPLSKFSNLWLWEKYDYKRFGIDCEIYLDIDYNEYAYLTDTGRCWDGARYNVWDHVKSDKFWPRYHKTQDIIQAIENGTFPVKSVINTHPQRWNGNIYEWTKELVMQNAKNQVKFLLMKIKK